MQGSDSFRLIVRRGPQPNQTYDLNKDIVTLGRDITNDIVINDPEASRHHLRLTRGADGFNIEDLGSTNGTFINGQRLSGVRPLNRGDMIGLGETVTLGYEQVRPVGENPPAPTAGSPMPQSPAPGYQQPSPYAPPQQQPYAQPQQPSNVPPQQPAYGQPAQPQQPAYGQPAQADYGQPAYGQDYGAQQQAAYGQSPAYGQQGYVAPGTGYDYDPYAIREEAPRSATRWIFIGCAVLGVFCCCTSVVGLVIIDALNLWYDLPIVSSLAPLFESIANALGLV